MSEISKRRWLTYDTPHADLRDFIDRADEAGELVHAKGVHWTDHSAWILCVNDASAMSFMIPPLESCLAERIRKFG